MKYVEKWINQILTTGLVVIFRSFFKEKLFRMSFFEMFYILILKWIDFKNGENVKTL